MTTKKAKPTRTPHLPKKAAKPVQAAAEPVVAPAEPTPAIEPATAPDLQEQPGKTAKPKKTAAPKAKPAKAGGKSVAIYAAALAHPDKAGDAFADLVIASGVKSSAETIGTIRSDFIRAVNFLHEQGLLKSPFKQ